MNSLIRSSDLKCIRDTVAELSRAEDFPTFSYVCLEGIGAAVRGEVNVIETWLPDFSAPIGWESNKSETLPLLTSYDEALRATIHTHPIIEGAGWEPIAHAPTRLSDWISMPALGDNPLFCEVQLKIGVCHQLTAQIGNTGDRTVLSAFNRDGADFSDREVATLAAFTTYSRPVMLALDARIKSAETVAAIGLFMDQSMEHSGLSELTVSEMLSVAALLRHGSMRQAALARGISVDTLSKSIQVVREKIGLENSRQLISLFRPLHGFRQCERQLSAF